VTTFAIAIQSGYAMSTLEVVGAVITIAALVANNVYQRAVIERKAPAAVPAVAGMAK
jgi:hypothetical protein